MDNQKIFTQKDMLQFKNDTGSPISKFAIKYRDLTNFELERKWFEEFETKETKKVISKL